MQSAKSLWRPKGWNAHFQVKTVAPASKNLAAAVRKPVR